MKLSNLTDDALREIALLKTRKGTATSEARRAAQILYTRHITRGGFGVSPTGTANSIRSSLDANIERNYQTFEEVHGCTLSEYLAH